jgi:hypothetical protein
MASRSNLTKCFLCSFWLSIGNENIVVLFIFCSNIFKTKSCLLFRTTEAKSRITSKTSHALDVPEIKNRSYSRIRMAVLLHNRTTSKPSWAKNFVSRERAIQSIGFSTIRTEMAIIDFCSAEFAA